MSDNHTARGTTPPGTNGGSFASHRKAQADTGQVLSFLLTPEASTPSTVR